MARTLSFSLPGLTRELAFSENVTSPFPTASGIHFINKADSVLAQQDQRIDSQRALRRNPCSHEAEQKHGQNHTA